MTTVSISPLHQRWHQPSCAQPSGVFVRVADATLQLVLEHPTCGAQWAVHSSKPLKFTVVVMIIVLLGSFGVGLMLDFIHIKRW
jgi:hypothetical protein